MNTNKSKTFVVNLDEYQDVEFDKEAVIKYNKKMPTSIALEPNIVEQLKKIANEKGIGYQVLMRIYIHEGLNREKNKAS